MGNERPIAGGASNIARVMTPTNRRHLLKLGLGLTASAAATTFCGPAIAAAAAPSQRRLALHNLHTNESFEAVYWQNGRYVPGELSVVNHVLRDYRSGDVHQMDPRLLDLLNEVALRTNTRGPFHVISGYRSPKTNAAMHARSNGVAKQSLHMQGLAIDIRLPDVDLAKLHQTALGLRRGGVGYYPADNFVHVDVGPVRQWHGTQAA